MKVPILSVRDDKGNIIPIPAIQGPKGDTGEAGYTPVRGTDYWTEEDKATMLTDVLAALPVYNGEVGPV